jgi:hypothetical protein
VELVALTDAGVDFDRLQAGRAQAECQRAYFLDRLMGQLIVFNLLVREEWFCVSNDDVTGAMSIYPHIYTCWEAQLR